MENETVSKVIRFIKQHHVRVRERIRDLIREITGEDAEQKEKSVNELLSQLGSLRSAYAAEDFPPWADDVEKQAKWYLNVCKSDPGAGTKLLRTIFKYWEQIHSEDLSYLAGGMPAIDFEAVYREEFSKTRIPELFDELVAKLEEVIAKGEIDSVRAIASLRELIATIQKNARGDYLSTRGTWEFVRGFMVNVGFEVIDGVPILGQVSKALRKTMSDMDVEFRDLSTAMTARFQSLGDVKLRLLDYDVPKLPAPPAQTDHEEILDGEFTRVDDP